ncbi:MAG TPA: TonB-dependent receptor [Pseudoxanthomonas sp.]|nr:TonB-dependent receptor [Pseudoxanthomonas sp.]
MNCTTNKLRDAITIALAVSTTTLASAGAALAQEASTSRQATNLDRIQVTGTRIRQVDLETAQPVLAITRQDIERQGFQTVADILQNTSAVGTPPISRASPLSSGENVGGNYISLRNLGAQRTLVLVNGKRQGISTSGLSDISQIPAAAVERIEILKDGASSIYGSDAIAGVINIITRSNFEGATASAYYGQYGEGDGRTTNGDFVIGFTGDRGSLTVAAEWGNEDPVKSSARAFSAFPRSSLHPTDNWTTVGQFGGFQPLWNERALFPQAVFPNPTATNPNPAGSRLILRPGGNPRLPADYVRQDTVTGGCTAATLANPGPGTCVPGNTADKSNTNQQTDLRTGLERKSLYVDGIFNITDNLRFRTDLLYSNRVAERQVAGFPLQATTPAVGGPATMAANSYFNPTGAPISNWWRRGWEVPRVSTSDLTTYRFSAALEGSFGWADRVFDWDVSYLNNTNKLNQSGFGDFNIAAVRAGVGPSFLNAQGRVQCGTPAAPIAFDACVPFNPFLPAGVAGPGGLTNNPQLQNALFQELHATGETETTIMAANLAGSIFNLPAGELGFAIGVEHRKEAGEFSPDALAVTGGSSTLSAGPTRGDYSVDEIYAELQVPILADLPFAKELSINLASRYSDYDTFGDTINHKFGFKWRPVESLLIRGTRAEGFRAPTLNDLFGGGSQTFSFYTDPCDVQFGSSANNTTTRQNCINGVGGQGALGAAGNTYRQLRQGLTPITTAPDQTPVPFTSGSNLLLTPETALSKTLGLVWSPGFAEGLNLSLDWFNIRVDNTIVADTPTTILNDCYVQGIASRCSAALFVRDPTQGNIPIVTFGNRNAGYREVEGYDFDIAYRFTTDNWGKFSLVSNTTYTSKDVFISTNDRRVPISSVGLAGTASTTFRIRSNLNLSWEYGSFGVSWMARYYSSMKESCAYFTPSAANVPPVTVPHLECNDITLAPTGLYLADGVTPASGLTRRNRTGSNTFNDVQFRWEAPWNATVAFGANNVLGRTGPVMYSQPSANVPYYGGFDIGRFMYMKYTQRF